MGPVHQLDAPEEYVSQVALAGNGAGFAAAWAKERTGLALRFQLLGPDGTPLGTPRTIDEGQGLDMFNSPALFAEADGGYTLVWSKQDWGMDGLYRLRLSPDGEPVGAAERVDWLVPECPGPAHAIDHPSRSVCRANGFPLSPTLCGLARHVPKNT